MQVVATGGIGGVHRGAERSFDESADSRPFVAASGRVVERRSEVVLISRLTLERLETLAAPSSATAPTSSPPFYVRSSGLRLAYA